MNHSFQKSVQYFTFLLLHSLNHFTAFQFLWCFLCCYSHNSSLPLGHSPKQKLSYGSKQILTSFRPAVRTSALFPHWKRPFISFQSRKIPIKRIHHEFHLEPNKKRKNVSAEINFWYPQDFKTGLKRAIRLVSIPNSIVHPSLWFNKSLF